MNSKTITFSPGVNLGLLGGGQLARMICLEAHKLGIETSVLSSHVDDPAAQVCNHWYKGDIHKAQDLRRFFQKVSTATFESEFLHPPTLKKAQKGLKTLIFPQPDTMAICQDRLLQKELLQKHKLPTSPFVKVDTFDDLKNSISQLELPIVLKKRYGGYDGYGTFIIKKRSDLKKIKPVIEKEPFGFIAEKFIPFKKEVALVSVRNLDGQVIQLPWVETHQENSRCLWVKGPITPLKHKTMENRITRMLNSIEYVGAIGLEFFIDHKQQLIVNEIAPRVHNSAHYSQDALNMSQFHLHIRAILNWDLTSPKVKAPGFAMLNLLGGNKKKPKWQPPSEVQLHWYGKKENRLGRKMGHLNTVGKTPQIALNRLLKCRKEFQL